MRGDPSIDRIKKLLFTRTIPSSHFSVSPRSTQHPAPMSLSLSHSDGTDEAIPLVEQDSTSPRHTASFESTLTTQRRHSIPRPHPPPPSATTREVEDFLFQYFFAKRSIRDKDEAKAEAEAKARALPMDGKDLYRLSQKGFTDAFGPEGELVYYDVQTADAGYVCLRFLHLELRILTSQFRTGLFGLYLRLHRKYSSLWLGVPDHSNMQKMPKTGTSPSRSSSAASLLLSSSSTGSAPWMESSTNHTSQSDSKSETKVQQFSCHSSPGNKDLRHRVRHEHGQSC